jgi:hypothetical protein
VTPPDVDSRTRNEAIDVVEQALRSGRIVQADHDMRIDQLRSAQSAQEVEMLVRDLRPAVATTATGAAPAAAQPVSGATPWPLVNYGPTHGPGAPEVATVVTTSTKSGGAVGGIIALVVVLAVVVPIAAAVIAFVSARDSFPSFEDAAPSDETTYLPGQPPGEDGVNLHTVEGFNELVDAVREAKGDTFAYTTVIYPRYAVADLPTGKNVRYEGWYWDGRTLTKNQSRGSATSEQFDLSSVDPEQLVSMLKTVRERLDDPDSWYVVISDPENLETQVSAYASNDFGESTYIVEKLDGTVVYDSEAQG